MPPETSSVDSALSSAGSTRFKIIAMRAAGKMPEVAKIFIVLGRYCSASGSSYKPSPKDKAIAKITILRRFQFTSDSIEMPAATTMP